MNEPKIAYEPHPVTPERKAELRAKGFTIVDAIYAPKGEAGSEAVEAIVPMKRDEDGGLTAGKGPGGRWFVKRGGRVVTGSFPDEAAAQVAAEKERG